MNGPGRNKKKIINDPVYGFIKIPFDSLFDLIEHPYFQRLRRIKQLGLTNYVYPGASHTRFQHALGSMHLMSTAIQALRNKDHEISQEEEEGALAAILLHDIGHGPFSHALENSIIENISHEELSLLFMQELNEQKKGRLDLAISIFTNKYSKSFLHELVSSQLDMDRLDYLKRDSFFTGVTEGVVGSDRIVRMLNVVDDKLVVDSKGIYSIEKFLIARRLMYWQVYLHKTVLSAELLLLNILKRAKEIADRGTELFCTPALHFFLYRHINMMDFTDKDPQPVPNKGKDNTGKYNRSEILDKFAALDDNDIISSAKAWTQSEDPVLSLLCTKLVNRDLYRVELQNQAFRKDYITEIKRKTGKKFNLGDKDIPYLVQEGTISNNAYSSADEQIQILYHGNILRNIAEASDMLDISVLSKNIEKYYLCYPKDQNI